MEKLKEYTEIVFKDLESQLDRSLTDEEKFLFIAGMAGAAAILQTSCASMIKDTKGLM